MALNDPTINREKQVIADLLLSIVLFPTNSPNYIKLKNFFIQNLLDIAVLPLASLSYLFVLHLPFPILAPL